MSTETPTSQPQAETIEMPAQEIKLTADERKAYEILVQEWKSENPPSKSDMMRRLLDPKVKEVGTFKAGPVAKILSAVTGSPVRQQFVYSVGQKANLIVPNSK